MANKYLALVGNKFKEIVALVISSGAGDAGKIVALDAAGKLDNSVLPTGIGAETVTATATEALAAGDFVNIYSSSGVKVRKADATTNGKPAQGFVLAAVSNTATATIYMISQTNNQVSGLTPGVDYFLSTTPGGVTSTAPSTAGNIVQYLGTASAAGELVFSNVLTIELA